MSLAAYRASGGTIITLEATFSKDYAQFALSGTGTAIIDWGDDMPCQTVELHELPYECEDMLKEDKFVVSHDFDPGIAQKITIAGMITGLCMGEDLLISVLDTSRMPPLKVLICYEAGLRTLDVSKNERLRYLRIEENALTELVVSKNNVLKHLDCEDNKLEHAELIAIFEALPPYFSYTCPKIICGGNPGYATITDDEKSILHNKKWELSESYG